MPFVHASMRLEELVSVRDMRNVVKQKFLEYKDVTDPRVRQQVDSNTEFWTAASTAPATCSMVKQQY